jgi:uncharacterized protein YndB with AHSA1/START domain
MTDELRLERVIDAPRDVVFDAFTTDGGQIAFYGTDDPGWIVESQCDLRVGGLWTVTFGPSPDHLYHHRSVFEVIDRPRRIVLATTEVRPEGLGFDFSVEFTFEEQDGRTRMSIIQSGFPTPELRDEHGRGVPNAFARLERAILDGPWSPGSTRSSTRAMPKPIGRSSATCSASNRSMPEADG